MWIEKEDPMKDTKRKSQKQNKITFRLQISKVEKSKKKDQYLKVQDKYIRRQMPKKCTCFDRDQEKNR